MENAAAAASLLDNKGTAALSSPGNSVNSSPASPATGSTSKALQSCWETYTSPFLLLAAAEALYAQERTPKLIALYVKIANDLTVVEQILCDPVLGSTESLHHATATSLTQHLVKLREWTSMRCQLLELILQAPSSLEQVLPGLQTLWLDVASRPSADDDMMKALQTEVQLWLWLIEACWHLQDCRFLDTILAVRRIKVKLESLETTTELHEWFGIALQEIHSILPIYFDHLKARVSPLYGFDPSRLGSPNMNVDYDGQILDFLRKHEGVMAVCIVLEDPTDDSWPATYLRSSIDSLPRSSSSGNSLSSRLLLGRREEEVDEVSPLEQYNSNQGWPHTEWKDLTTILRNEVNPEELGPAMTFRAKETEMETASAPSTSPDFLTRPPAAPASYFHVAALSSTSCLWLVAIVKGDDAAAENRKWNLRISRGVNHHTEEDIRAFLDDMAAKLRVSNLMDNTTFEHQTNEDPVNSNTATTLVDSKSKKSLSAQDLVLEWTEPKTQDCLRTIKAQFGLRPQSPMVTPLRSPYQLNFQSYGSENRRLRGRKRRDKNIEESAAAWFLGPDLMKMANNGKLKHPQS